MILTKGVPAVPVVRRLVMALLAPVLALTVSGLTAPHATASTVIWDDPLTLKVEKRPKVKVSKSEYRKITRGLTYGRVKKIADGPGEYFGPCVEGGPCGNDVRWYMWRYRGGKVKYDGRWYGRFVMVAFTNGKVTKKFHS